MIYKVDFLLFYLLYIKNINILEIVSRNITIEYVDKILHIYLFMIYKLSKIFTYNFNLC